MKNKFFYYVCTLALAFVLSIGVTAMATASVKVYLDNEAGWSEPIYCYAYVYDETTQTTKSNAGWPGATMTLDEDTGYYTLDLTSDFDESRCIFYSASGRYPADGVPGLATGGSSKLFNNSTNTWTDYTQKPIITLTESRSFTY